MQDLIDSLKYKCNYNHGTRCIPITKKILSIYNTNKTIDQDLLSAYLNYLITQGYSKCYTLKEHRDLIKEIFSNIIPNGKNIALLLDIYHKINVYYDTGYIEDYDDSDDDDSDDNGDDSEGERKGPNNKNKTKKSNKQQDEANTEIIEILQSLVNRKVPILLDILKVTMENKMLSVCQFLIKNVAIDTECIEVTCLHGQFDLLPFMFGQKLKATSKSLENCLEYYAQNKNSSKYKSKKRIEIRNATINMLMKYGAEPNIKCLINTCMLKDKDLITKFLSYKIIPNTKCFDALITRPVDHNNRYGRYRKKASSKHSKQATDADLVAELIDMLITNGYKVTLDDVLDALENGYYINDIKRFNLKLTHEFIDRYYEIGYFPYKDLDIKPTLSTLKTECKKSGNLSTIKALVKQGLEPNLECLQNACSVGSNIGTIRYLLEDKKIKPDLQCIKNLANSLNSNSQLNLLLSHYNPAEDKTVVVKDDKDNDDNDNDKDSEEKQIIKQKGRPKRSPVGKSGKKIVKKNKVIQNDDSISDEE